MTVTRLADAGERVGRIVETAVADGVFPGAALVVGSGREIIATGAFGLLAPDDRTRPVQSDSIYDLSSLTKPLATVASLLVLVQRGSVTLDARVAELVPAFGRGTESDRARVTVADLLSHSSGLPAHRPYFESLPDPAEVDGDLVLAAAAAEPLERARGSSAVYSDLGFMLLGRIVEVVAGARLDRVFAEEVARPLGLRDSFFVDVVGTETREERLRRTAPCGYCPWRGRTVHGVVHDQNAYAMGGIAGHAGLFSSAGEVHALVAEYVAAAQDGGKVLDGGLVREVWTKSDVPGSTWALGWDTPSLGVSSAGQRVSARAVGHLGFTGTSVWIDLARGVHVILLSNRVHAAGDNGAIRELRPRLHDAVWEVLR